MVFLIAADILIKVDSTGNYWLFTWPNLPPADAPYHPPQGIQESWHFSGTVLEFFSVKVPGSPTTLERIRQYLADLRAAGVKVRPKPA